MTSRLRVSSEVAYLKSVWGFVKNMIEKNALEGIRDYFEFLVESLRRETTEGQWPKKAKVPALRRHRRNRSLKNKEMTEPVKEISMVLQRSSTQSRMAAMERQETTGPFYDFLAETCR
ncbi:PREDICTED: GRAM domain-containing protein 1C-like [Acropora digitifera]|uniref:GRAM domain-containing protein 1C-like n=1 Tax=Acropora digitifera TaxID=70779 RepID=UPI00077A00E2|nr:PREDICTED: GRAM domain-containing protein 1C-like [Acropora digitifera]